MARASKDGAKKTAAMDNVGRLLLRVILIPLGYFAAVVAGPLGIVIRSWEVGRLSGYPHPPPPAGGLVWLFFSPPVPPGRAAQRDVARPPHRLAPPRGRS